MKINDQLYLTLATILFVGLFSFTMLPGPLEDIGNFIQGGAFSIYKIVRVTGGVTDAGMCVLADLWNLGGIEATVIHKGDKTNTTCATLTENKIAITPKDEQIFGAELGGVVQSIYIKDKRTLNKLFYVSYVLFGLVIAGVLTDIWLSTHGGNYGTAKMVGFTAMATLGVTMTLFRSGAMWGFLTLFANMTPGNSMLADGLFIVLSLNLVWWVISQIMVGYHATQQNYKKFAAVRMASKADYERGLVAMNAIEGKK